MRIVTLLFLLGSCAAVPSEEYRWAEEHYYQVHTYCSSNGFATNVVCEAGRACQKRPNKREMRTAYCVIWK